jgi:hypothetical protein
MSHIAQIELEIRDLDALAAACETLGLELVRNQKTYRCWGTGKNMGVLESQEQSSLQRGQGKLMPTGFALADMGKCDHAIRVKNSDQHTYEIGLAARRDGRSGYLMLWDAGMQAAARLVKNVGGEKAELLCQGYAVEVAMRIAKRQGFRVVKKEVRSDGSIAIITQR